MTLAIKKDVVRGYKKIYTNKAGTGFIKMMIGWEASPIFEGRKDYQDIFLCLVRIANYKNTHEIVGRKRIELQRGQCFTSVREIAEATGLLAYDDDGLPLVQKDGKFKIKEQVVRSALLRFKEAEMITDEAWNRGRVITVLNYEKYQSKTAVHENVYYPSFQKSKVIEALTEERKGLPILNKTSKKRTTNEQLTSYISNTEQTNQTDKKEERKYKEKTNEHFSNQKSDSAENAILEEKTSEKPLNTSNSCERFTHLKEAFLKAFNLKPESECKHSKRLANTIERPKLKAFLQELQQKNATQEKIELVFRRVASAKELRTKKSGVENISYYLDCFKEMFEAFEEEMTKKENIEDKKISLIELTTPHYEMKELNDKFADDIKESLGEAVFFAWFRQVFITGFYSGSNSERLTPILTCSSEKIKNCIYLHYQNRLDKITERLCRNFFPNKAFRSEVVLEIPQEGECQALTFSFKPAELQNATNPQEE